MKALAITVLAAAALIACGGGGGNDSETSTGSQTGVFTDAAVQGVSYTTSSGVTGVTNAAGEYNFNPGDKVTFRLGSLVLGEVPAKGILTPIDLAADSQTKLTNLLVVLQSLDSDGDADNGITIPAAAASAMPSLNLASATTASLTTPLQQARTAANITKGGVVDPEDAKDHFLDQAKVLLASNIWIHKNEEGIPAIAIYSNKEGQYIMGEHADDGDSGGQPGVEYGTVGATDVDPRGFRFVGSAVEDFNGDWGLSDLQDSERFNFNGDSLRIGLPESGSVVNEGIFTKMENNPAGIVGAWVLSDDVGSTIEPRLFLFFSDNRVMMLDMVGDPDCGAPGYEIGTYEYNASTKALTLAANPLANENGCAGLWENSGVSIVTGFTLGSDGKTATISFTDGQAALKRVSK